MFKATPKNKKVVKSDFFVRKTKIMNFHLKQFFDWKKNLHQTKILQKNSPFLSTKFTPQESKKFSSHNHGSEEESEAGRWVASLQKWSCFLPKKRQVLALEFLPWNTAMFSNKWLCYVPLPWKTSCRQFVQSILPWILGDLKGVHLNLFRRHPNFVGHQESCWRREK